MSSYNSLKDLVEIHSPTGYTTEAGNYIYNFLSSLGYSPEYSNKGAVKCRLGENPVLAIAAHIDTLGAIVSGINKNGTLRISQLGGWPPNSFEGEYVTVITLDNKKITGTLLIDNPSAHANNLIVNTERKLEKMHIRLDEEVHSKKDVEDLGIRIGDIIAFDTRYQELSSGFIKSRFMDNKAGCYVLMELAKKYQNKNIPVELFFSVYEEVGHGGTCGYASSIEELLVIDMGVLGDACEGDEYSCSICAKDSSGPYDYEFRKKLVNLAETNKIPFKLDVYPFYGSDGSAALRAGKDYRVALIGPGVAASHGVERTHKKGIEATIALCEAYIESKFQK
jgi:putative aminopeptidase FrvX